MENRNYEVRVFDSRNTSRSISIGHQDVKGARECAKATAAGVRDREGLKIDSYLIESTGFNPLFELYENGERTEWSYPDGLNESV